MIRTHSAQGSQRRLLRIRESTYVAVVEPFIGPIGSQGRQMLVIAHVPELDRAIFPATSDRMAIGVDAHGPGSGLV